MLNLKKPEAQVSNLSTARLVSDLYWILWKSSWLEVQNQSLKIYEVANMCMLRAIHGFALSVNRAALVGDRLFAQRSTKQAVQSVSGTSEFSLTLAQRCRWTTMICATLSTAQQYCT